MSTSIEPSINCPILIERAPHLETLTQLWREAGRGLLRTALITGEAGIGKSRLINEFITQQLPLSAGIKHTNLQGRCFESDQLIPYAPIIDMLRTFLAKGMVDEIARIIVPTELVKLLPELIYSLPELKEQPVSEPDKYRLSQSLLQFFIHLSTSAPLVIVVEDLQWGDSSSLDFLTHLSQRLANHPILLLLTYRIDEIHDSLLRFLANTEREHNGTTFTLQRLSLRATEKMVQAIFNFNHRLPPEFVNIVYRRTEGNPFFIEELLKSLNLSSDYFDSDEKWRQKLVSDHHIPRTVQMAVKQRINLLSPKAKHLLRLLAVIGKQFHFNFLQYLTGEDETTLLLLLKEMISAQLIVEGATETFTFRHALTRRAIYTDLLTREIRVIHGIVAEALETFQQRQHQTETPLSDLAYHHYQARNWQKAFHYSRRAGEQATSLFSPGAALEHFSRAVDAAGRLEITPPSALYLARGQAYEQLGDFEAALYNYEQALRAARQTADERGEWQALLDLGWLWTGRDYTQAGNYFDQALELAHRMQEQNILADTLNRLGNWHLHADQPHESLRFHSKALEIFRSLNDQQNIALAYDLLGVSSFANGDLITGRSYYDKAIALWRESQQPQGLVSSLSIYGMGSGSYLFDTLVYPSDVAIAKLCLISLEEAIGLARQIGWLAGEANALIDYALTLGARGHYATALEAAQTALTIAVEIDHAMWHGTACLALGALYLDLLNAPKAQSYLEVAWKVAEGLNSIYIRRTIGGFLAYAYLEQHMFDQASDVLDQVIDLDAPLTTQAQRIAWTARAAYCLAIGDFQSGLDILNRLIASACNLTDHSAVIPRLWLLRGEGLQECQQWPEAEESLRTALQSAKKQNIQPLVWRIQVSLGTLYKTTTQLAEAEKMFESARRLIEELAATLDTSTSQEFLEQALKMIPHQPLLTSHQAAKRKYGGLTRREREVAIEIAVGKSNQEIADTLVISERTVEKHVSNILSKLYFTSRREIAAWTVEKGLTRSK